MDDQGDQNVREPWTIAHTKGCGCLLLSFWPLVGVLLFLANGINVNSGYRDHEWLCAILFFGLPPLIYWFVSSDIGERKTDGNIAPQNPSGSPTSPKRGHPQGGKHN